MGEILYFAYGSNMCTGRLKKRCPSAKPQSVAELGRHKFYFHKKSKDGSAKADAEYTGNDENIVWGVIFSIDKREENNLDKAEGLEHGYNKDIVEVVDREDNSHKVKIYRADQQAIDKTLKPYSWYKRFVIEGAKQHNLPEVYINQINKFEDIKDSDEERDRKNRAVHC